MRHGLVRALLLGLLVLVRSSSAWATGPINYPPGSGSGGGAPTDATYITEIPDATLSAEFAMSTLGTGLVKNTTATGVPSIYAGSGTCAASSWITALDPSGAKTCGTVNFTDLLGTATAAQSPLATLLAGRAGTGNDTTLNTTAAGTGTIYGASTTTGNLTLRANSADTTTGVINLNAPSIVLYPSFPAAPTTTVTLLSSTPTTTLTSGTGNYVMANAAPVITVADTTGSAYFVAGGTVERTGTSGGTLYGVTGFNNTTKFASGTSGGPLLPDSFVDNTTYTQYGNAACISNGVPRACCTNPAAGSCTNATQNTWVPIAFQNIGNVNASGDATFTLGRATTVYSRWQITSEKNAQCGVGTGNPYPCCTGSGTGTCGTTSAATLTRAEALHMINPVLTGSALVTNVVGLSIDSLTSGGTQNTSLESLGTATDMRHAGPARFGATGAPSTGYSVDSAGAIQIGTAGGVIADVSSGTTAFVSASDSVDMTGGNLYGLTIQPTSTLSGGGATPNVGGVLFSPTLTETALIPTIIGFQMTGSSNSTAGTLQIATAVNNSMTYTSATAGVNPVNSVTGLSEAYNISSTATSGSPTIGSLIGVSHTPNVEMNGTGGTLNLTDDIGLNMGGNYKKTLGTLNVTNRIGVRFKDVTFTSTPTLTNNLGIDVQALANGTNNIAYRTAIVAGANNYAFRDTGGAQVSLVGKITTYNNVAADASNSGVPFTVGSVTALAQTADVASTNVVASTAAAGRYQVCAYAAITTAATTSSVLPTTSFTCTDPTDSVAKTFVVTPSSTANTTATAVSGCGMCTAKVSTAIKYLTTGYVSVGGTAMQFKTYVTATAM